MNDKIILEIKTSRTGEETPDSMTQFLTSLASIKVPKSLFSKPKHSISLEIVSYKQIISFYLVIPAHYQSFIESQLLSQYPRALITMMKEDPLTTMVEGKRGNMEVGRMQVRHSFLYPINTYKEFKDIDPISSILGMLSKLERDDFIVVQFMLTPAGDKWQRKGQKMIDYRKDKEAADSVMLNTYAKQIGEKIAFPGFKVGIRLLTHSEYGSLLELIAACFNSFNKVDGNGFTLEKPFFWQKNKFISSMINRTNDFVSDKQILNVAEVATMYHFPNEKLSTIPNIAWAKTIRSDAPENLPVPVGMDEETKKNTNFFAKTEFKNHSTTFGIYRPDRRRHMYIVGKTGTGKSTFISNMAINDMRNGEGLCVIDPHGDLVETLLDFVPANRINDVVYLNPADTEFPFSLNPLEVYNTAQKELIASGIVAIFYKLYANSWGPRLEYILRNTLITLVEVPDATLMMVPELLTNTAFRKKVVSTYITDPVIKSFWINEFDTMQPKMMQESISPILNKVGQFLSSPTIRNIVGSPKATINLEDCMNEGKIVLMNLSQGRIGEDNATLLGAMIITKLQLAAMNRVTIPEEERRDFYLYVDEFQNFATSSFTKILSEARKYRLCLILANQYISQIEEGIRSAIFGNAGTIISLLVGAEDSPYLAREFGERFKEDDLLGMGNHQMLIKMCINGLTSAPFFAQTLPLPNTRTESREKVIRSSRERYAKHIDKINLGVSMYTPEPQPAPEQQQQRSYEPWPQNQGYQQRDNNYQGNRSYEPRQHDNRSDNNRQGDNRRSDSRPHDRQSQRNYDQKKHDRPDRSEQRYHEKRDEHRPKQTHDEPKQSQSPQPEDIEPPTINSKELFTRLIKE